MKKFDKKDFDIAENIREDRKERIKKPLILTSIYIGLFIFVAIFLGVNETARECIRTLITMLKFTLPIYIVILCVLSYTSYSVYSIYAVDYKMEENGDNDRHYVKDGDTDEWVEVEKTRFVSLLTNGVDHYVLIRKTLFSKKILSMID